MYWFIDQYEELITQCLRPQDRIAFEQQIAEWLVKLPNLKIILSIRSDFEPQFEGEALKTWWDAGRYIVPAFSLEEIREVITKPAAQSVLFYEPVDLVDRLEEEVSQAPGALPLLSFTLSELYEAYINSGREDRALTLDDYYLLGGVIGALRTSANAVYDKLDTISQNSMQKLMLRMVSLEGGELARKRVFAEDLVYTQDGESERLRKLGDKLVDARLVRSGKDIQGRIFLEPAHDALVRAWSRLWDWIKETGKENLQLYVKLNQAVADYHSLNEADPKKAKKLLWNDNPRLELLVKEMENGAHPFNAREETFIKESVALKKKNRNIFYATLISVSLVIGALIFYGVDRSEFANRQKLEAESQNLLGQAQNVHLTQPGLAIRLVREAWEKTSEPLPEVQQYLFEIFNDQLSQEINSWSVDALKKSGKPLAMRNLKQPNDPIAFAIFTADASHILTHSVTGKLRLWDRAKMDFQLLEAGTGRMQKAKLSKDGRYILSISEDGKVYFWNQKGEAIDSISQTGKRCVFTAFTRKAHHVLIQTNDRELFLWDLKQKKRRDLPTPDGHISDVAFPEEDSTVYVLQTSMGVYYGQLDTNKFSGNLSLGKYAFISPNGKYVWQSGEESDNNYHSFLWSVRENASPLIQAYSNGAFRPLYSPDGKYVLIANNETDKYSRRIQIWELYQDRLPRLVRTLPFTEKAKAVISPNSKFAILTEAKDEAGAVVPDRKTVLLRFAPRPDLDLTEFLPDITGAAFSPDSKSIIGWGGKNTRRIRWEPESAGHVLHAKIETELDLDGKLIDTVIISHDGKSILARTTEGKYAIWDDRNGPFFNLHLPLGRSPQEKNSLAKFSPDGQKIFIKVAHHLHEFSMDGVDHGKPEVPPFVEGKSNRPYGGFSAKDDLNYNYAPDSTMMLYWKRSVKDSIWVKDSSGRVLDSLFTPEEDFKHLSPIWAGREDAIIIEYENGVKRLWSFGKGTIVDTTDTKTFYFSTHGPYMVEATANTTMLWDYHRLKPLKSLHTIGEQVLDAHFSPLNDQLILYGSNNSTRLWTFEGDFSLLGYFPIDGSMFSPSGQYILTTDSGTVNLWNREVQLLARASGHTNSVFEVAFSPDETHFVTLAVNESPKLWKSPQALYEWVSNHEQMFPDLSVAQQVDYLAYTFEDFEKKTDLEDRLKVARYYASLGKLEWALPFYQAVFDSLPEMMSEYEKTHYFGYSPDPELIRAALPDSLLEGFNQCDERKIAHFFLNYTFDNTNSSTTELKAIIATIGSVIDDEYRNKDEIDYFKKCEGKRARKISREEEAMAEEAVQVFLFKVLAISSEDPEILNFQIRLLNDLDGIDVDSIIVNGKKQKFDYSSYLAEWLKKMRLPAPDSDTSVLNHQLLTFYLLYDFFHEEINDPLHPDREFTVDSIYQQWISQVSDTEVLLNCLSGFTFLPSRYGQGDYFLEYPFRITIDRIEKLAPRKGIIPVKYLNFGDLDFKLEDYLSLQNPHLLLKAAYYEYFDEIRGEHEVMAQQLFRKMMELYPGFHQPNLRERILFLNLKPAELSIQTNNKMELLTAARIFEEKNWKLRRELFDRLKSNGIKYDDNILSTEEKVNYFGKRIQDFHIWKNNYEPELDQLLEATGRGF